MIMWEQIIRIVKNSLFGMPDRSGVSYSNHQGALGSGHCQSHCSAVFCPGQLSAVLHLEKLLDGIMEDWTRELLDSLQSSLLSWIYY